MNEILKPKMSDWTKNTYSSESNNIKNDNNLKGKNDNEDLYENQDEKEQQNFLNNPKTFKRKLDLFSFYSKYRKTAPIPHSNEGFHFKNKRFPQEVILEEKPEYPECNKF